MQHSQYKVLHTGNIQCAVASYNITFSVCHLPPTASLFKHQLSVFSFLASLLPPPACYYHPSLMPIYLHQKVSISYQHVRACVYLHLHWKCFIQRLCSSLKARLDLTLPIKLYQLLTFPFPSTAFVWSTWFGIWLCSSIISYMQLLFPQKD